MSLRSSRNAQRLCAAVAVLFGMMTLFAGGRVLGGADPGYVVFKPLLIYNVVMGALYIAVGVVIARSLTWGKSGAGMIFVLNLLVFAGTIILYRSGGAVAVDSLKAMTLRTSVWLVLFLVVAWLGRRREAIEPPQQPVEANEGGVETRI